MAGGFAVGTECVHTHEWAHRFGELHGEPEGLAPYAGDRLWENEGGAPEGTL